MATLYAVPNWEADFENSKSRTIERASFFCVPNQFDGKKIKRMGKQENAGELYGIFHAICGVASKCDWRGVLLDKDGPINAEMLEEKTVFRKEQFERALEVLSRIGLLEKYEIEKTADGWRLPVSVTKHFRNSSDRRAAKAGHSRSDSDTSDSEASPNGQKRPPEADNHSGSDTSTEEVSGADTFPSKVPPKERKKEEKGKKEEKERNSSRAEEDSDPIQHAEAKILLSALAIDVFDERISDADWSNPQKDVWLADVVPLRRDEWALIEWAYRMSGDDPLREQTHVRKSFLSLLENFRREVQKLKTVKKEIVAAGGESGFAEKSRKTMPEPPGWREFFRWKYNPEVHLPETFALLPPDLMNEWELGHEEFELAMVKGKA